MSSYKVLSVCVLVIGIWSCLAAQSSDLAWATKAGGVDIDDSAAIAVDETGNSYVTGYFNATTTFGTTDLTSAGLYDIFVAKMDPLGNWLWAKRAGGTGSDVGAGIAVDVVGNVYITGSISSRPASFDTLSVSSFNTANDIFVAKLDANGNWLWVSKAGNRYIDNGLGVAVDDDFNVYVTGSFLYYATFGSIPTFYGHGQSDCFVAKLDSNGTWLWAEHAGGVYNEAGKAISLDSDGNLCITGSFTSPSATFGNATLANMGGNNQAMDVFVATINPLGTWIWANSAGGLGSDTGCDIETDSFNNVYITGTTELTINFGSIILQPFAGYDVFVAKLDMLGNWVWASRAGGDADDFGWGIAVDNDYLYATGEFRSIAVFDSISLTCLSASSSDVYFSKLDSYSGEWISAESANGFGTDIGTGVAVGPGSSVFWLGNFFEDIVFDSDTSLMSTLNSQDIYVAKMMQAPALPIISNVVVNGGSPAPLAANFSYPIDWDASGLAQVMLDYGIIDDNNDITWYPIESVPVDASLGTYMWTAPQVSCAASKVRVRGIDSGVQMESSQILSIYEPLKLNGIFGSTENMGVFLNTTSQLINWSVHDTTQVSQVLLDYSVDDGAAWVPIITSPISADQGMDPGGYLWDLPNINCNTVRIRVRSASDSLYFARSSIFSIIEAVTLLSFTGGSTYEAASTHEIVWVADPMVQQVALEYSLDAGSTWQTITASIPADMESYPWMLPYVSSQTARVRVQDTSNENAYAESSQNFSITYAPSAPQGMQLVISQSNPHDLQISWIGVTTDIENGPLVASAYSIYYCTEASDNLGDYTYLTTVTDGTSYVHQGVLLSFDRLFYRIIALTN